CAFVRRDVIHRCVLTELQRSNVRDDGPTIFNGNLFGITRHNTEAIRDHVKVVANWRLPQSINVIGVRTFESAAHDHSLAGSKRIMTWCAVNVVAFLPSLHHGLRDFKWECGCGLSVDLACIKMIIIAELSACDSSFYGRAFRSIVSEEI